MADTQITINRDPTSPARVGGESCASLRSKGGPQRRRGSLASVTLTLGAATVIVVGAIGFLSLVIATSRVTSQSGTRKIVASQDDSQLEALHIEKREQGACPEELCLTKECVHAASSFLEFIDETVDPCDDFYRYACGGWMKKNEHEVASENLVYSLVFNVLSDSIDTTLKHLLRTGGNVPEEILQTKPYEDLFLFYERCRAVEGSTQDMSPVHEVLRTLDKFQVGKPFDSSKWDLTSALQQLLQVNGAPLFDIDLDSDVDEVGKFTIIITSPRDFGLISRLARHPPHSRNRNLQQLKKFVRERGRGMLFGSEEEAVRKALGRDRLKRDTFTRHALQRDAVENLVSASDLKVEEEEEGEGEGEETTTVTFTESSSTTTTSLHSTTPPTTTTTTHVTNHTINTTTATATATTTTATNTTNTTTTDEEEPMWMSPPPPVSRRVIYRIFQHHMDEKRLESLASTLHDAFPNASLLSTSSSTSSSSSSSSSSTPPSASSTDGDAQDDIYSEVIMRFLPILQELLPSEREELEIQQGGKQYNHFTIGALQQMCPVIDWLALIGGLLNLNVTEKYTVYIHYPDHLTNLCTLLDNTEPWVIHYAMLTLYSYDVLQETVYATEGMDREDFCLQAVKGVFGEVMSNLYLHHIGNETLKNIQNSASSLMDMLREEVEDSVSGAEWLGKEDKEKVLKKLHSLKLQVGAREAHWDIEFINKSHAELTFPPNASFLHTTLELHKTFRRQLYNLHSSPMDVDEFIWSFTVQPYKVIAFYSVYINSIVFPEAFFHPPYYRQKVPQYLNFGSTGAPIAHEIFHALDFLGIQFDERGLLTRPFSDDMIERLNVTSDCYHNLLNESFFEIQYMHDRPIALEIDDSITKNENLADLSGVRTAFKSYRRWEEVNGVEPRLPALPLSPHQLFFLASVQPFCSITSVIGNILLMEVDEHLPDNLRINGIMKNMPEFSQVFSCSPTSKMFSDQTCQLF